MQIKLARIGIALTTFLAAGAVMGQLMLRPDVKIPELPGFKPLPAEDKAFSAQITELVKKAGLAEHTPANQNPDKEEEWSSICVVDLHDLTHVRVGGWEADNFLYPASTYKMYVVGEAIRQVCAGERSLDDPT